MSVEPWENDAILYGGKCGGEYLESINKTDLATLTPDQWLTFLQVVTINYHSKHIELQPCPF